MSSASLKALMASRIAASEPASRRSSLNAGRPTETSKRLSVEPGEGERHEALEHDDGEGQLGRGEHQDYQRQREKDPRQQPRHRRRAAQVGIEVALDPGYRAC